VSDRIPVGNALEQLRELIAILRELGNAGPRDNSFKQWRQVTLTLLQRMWPGDQTRAVRFRRIPFSAPSLRADAKTIRECYVRGVNEAIAYLEGLALEVETASGKLGRSLVRPPEAPLAPDFFAPATDGVAPPPASARPGPPASAPAAPAPQAQAQPQPQPPAAQRGPAAKPESSKVVARPRQRLKDMLGFGEEGGASSAPEGPTSAGAAEAPAPVEPPTRFRQFMPEAPPSTARAAPAAFEARSPAPPREERPAPPVRSRPEPAAEFDGEPYAFDFDLTDEVESDAELPPATLREMLERETVPSAAAPSRAAREVLSMAGMVDQLGVPPQRQAIVRAALIDLGQQMDAPPVDWVALRQAFAFVMEYPQIARRVIPMLMPYLDEAA
jgi:hypothetical protein